MDNLEELAGEVIEEISPNDVMLGRKDAKGRKLYLRSGYGTLRLIRLAMLAAGRQQVESILDFGCGHGRVLRFLKAAFPDASLTACDVNRDGVEYCASAFSAMPVHSHEDPSKIEIADSFDLIWSGSVLTHLDANRWTELLSFFVRSLAVDGLLVFTTAGRHAVELMRSGELHDISEDGARELIDRYEHTGFGYCDYENRSGYGLARSTPAWVCGELSRHPALRLVLLKESGWAGRQDVFACVKSPG